MQISNQLNEMRRGLLKEQITIMKNVITTNDYGEQTSEWVEKDKTRARLIHTGGNRMVSEEVFYSSSKIFQISYYIDIDEFDRIVWDNKTYRIINIEPDVRDQSKTIKAELVND